MKINALKSDDFYIDCRNLKIYDITKSIVSFEDLGIEDIDTSDAANIFTIKTRDGSVFEIETRKIE